MSYCTCHGKCIFADPLHLSHACHRFWKRYKTLQNHHVLLTFDKVHNPLRLPREATPKRPTRARICGALNILTSKYASRHNYVQFLDISTSKSGPNMVCFVMFCTFWLGNVLRATTACNFFGISTSKSGPELVFCTFWLRNLLRTTTACNFSSLASWLRTPRFSEPTFRPSRASNHWKNTMFRDFPTFSRTWIFFLLTLSLSSSRLFSDSSHLCFSSVHVGGSLTSKLPSTINVY